MAEDKKKDEFAVIDITEEYLKERIYEIRGQRVILDADLSEIYGYTTKAFNQQVKNNIEKFDEDFMFELTDDEVENLRSNFLTANLNSKSRYNPHVFTCLLYTSFYYLQQGGYLWNKAACFSKKTEKIIYSWTVKMQKSFL